MKRVCVLTLSLLCANVRAHLNHVQFAAIEEVDGKLRVRYRMSADMFMSNLDADIKRGRLIESIKQRPIDDIIREYFKTHLLLEAGGAPREADSASFTFDAKTSDWVADFLFQAPAPDARIVLFCDAFLENNPRTQTLARIDWRGDKTMFHFRNGNVRYVLGSSLQPPQETQARAESGREFFLDGLARALKAYDFLAAGALVLIVLGRMPIKWPHAIVPAVALAASVALSIDQCGHENAPLAIGFAFGWLAVALTAYGLSVFALRTGPPEPRTSVSG